MKNAYIGFLSLFLWTGSVSASYLLQGAGFVAPNVTATSGIANPVTGEIVFDATSGTFYGYDGVSPWMPLSAPANPTLPTVDKKNATSTYSPSASGLKYIRVRAVGGGGAGGGAGTTGCNGLGGDGGATTFGSFITANGGKGGCSGEDGDSTTIGKGGTASLGGGASGYTLNGSWGLAGDLVNTSGAIYLKSGAGGATTFGGAGRDCYGSLNGDSALMNTGSGGGGACIGPSAANNYSGSGGGAGGYAEAIIPASAMTFPVSYSIGAGGTGSSSGATYAGGNGGSGTIIIEEYFQ